MFMHLRLSILSFFFGRKIEKRWEEYERVDTRTSNRARLDTAIAVYEIEPTARQQLLELSYTPDVRKLLDNSPNSATFVKGMVCNYGLSRDEALALHFYLS